MPVSIFGKTRMTKIGDRSYYENPNYQVGNGGRFCNASMYLLHEVEGDQLV